MKNFIVLMLLTFNVFGQSSRTQFFETWSTKKDNQNLILAPTGTGSITSAFDFILSGTGQIQIPLGTTAQRSGTPAAGMFRFNSTLTQFEGYDGVAWGAIGGGGGGGSVDSCYLSEQQVSGTNGGTFTSGAWRARTLNTTSGACSFLSLLSNTITINAGTYNINCSAPAYAVDQMKLRFRNTSDAATAIVGTSTIADSANIIGAVSLLEGQLTIASAKSFVLQHFSATTRSTTGFGIASGTGEVEVYASCKISKIN